MDIRSSSTIDIDLSDVKSVVNDKYYKYLKNKKRYMVTYGGAGSGKSHFIAQKILLRILMGYSTKTKHKFLCLRKTMPSVRKSIFSLFTEYIYGDEYGWGLGPIVNINKTEMLITFSNGSQIMCGGLDDPEKLKSINGITSAWLEEANEMTKDDFRQVDLRIRGLTKTYKQIAFSFNPVSKLTWIYDEFFETKKKETTIIQSTYKDNRFLDQKYIDMIEGYKEIDPVYYQIYTLGEWGSLEHIIYNKFDTIDFPEEDSFKDACYGLDYGYNANSALSFNGVKDNEYYVKELLYEKKLTHNDIIKKLGELIPLKYRRKRILYVDSAEPELIKELVSSGFLARMSDKSVKDGIDHIKTNKLFIDNKSVNLIKEIRGYKYRQDRDGYVHDEPVKLFDHMMDSMRYAIYTHWGKFRPKASIIFA